MVRWLRICVPNAEDLGSIPGQGKDPIHHNEDLAQPKKKKLNERNFLLAIFSLWVNL